MIVMSGRREMRDAVIADLAVRRYVSDFSLSFFLFGWLTITFFNSRDDTVNANVTVIHTADVSAR